MKTKQFIAVALIAVATLAFIGCNKDEPNPCTCNPKDHLQAGETCKCGGEGCNCTVEQPKDQTATITVLDNNATATVKGYMTNTEWNGVADKIKTAINARFYTRPDEGKAVYRTVFGVGVTIIVEKSPEGYTNWKTIGDGKTIYISLSAVNSDNPETLLGPAIISLSNSATQVAKVIDNSNAVRIAIQPKQVTLNV